MDSWMVRNPGKRVTDYDLCTIFTPAYNRIANAEKAVKGFKAIGIYPFNPEIFSDDDYMPSSVTEQVDPASLTEGLEEASCSGQDPKSVPIQQKRKRSKQASTKAKKKPAVASPVAASTCISVAQLSPYPRVTGCTPRKRKAQTSTVLTSTPNKKHLEEIQSAKNRKQVRLTSIKVAKWM